MNNSFLYSAKAIASALGSIALLSAGTSCTNTKTSSAAANEEFFLLDDPADAKAFAASQSGSPTANRKLVKVEITLGDSTNSAAKGLPSHPADVGVNDSEFRHSGYTVHRKPLTFELVRELVSPTDFDAPKLRTGDDAFVGGNIASFPVTPESPKKFATTNLGWKISMTPTWLSNGQIRLDGKARHVGAEVQRGVHGERGKPIAALGEDALGRKVPVILTENKTDMAVKRQVTTPFILYAVPGKSYVVPVARGSETVPLRIKCSEHDPSGKPVVASLR